jgi:hypothetical protein
MSKMRKSPLLRLEKKSKITYLFSLIDEDLIRNPKSFLSAREWSNTYCLVSGVVPDTLHSILMKQRSDD